MEFAFDSYQRWYLGGNLTTSYMCVIPLRPASDGNAFISSHMPCAADSAKVKGLSIRDDASQLIVVYV